MRMASFMALTEGSAETEPSRSEHRGQATADYPESLLLERLKTDLAISSSSRSPLEPG